VRWRTIVFRDLAEREAPTRGVISAAKGQNAALADMIAGRRWYFRGPLSQTPAGLRSFALAVRLEDPMQSAFVISGAPG
jgi:hypothetical protein